MPDDAHRPCRFRVSPIFALIVTASLGLSADQFSKTREFQATSHALGPRKLTPWLASGILARNDGVMANLAGGNPLTGRLSAMGGILLFGASVRAAGRWRRREAAFAGLLGAGMLGNAADRLTLGYVRDFLVVSPLPAWIFNLADVYIVVGALLLLGSWLAATLERRTFLSITNL
jgi:lipoprotein signal peptidase